MTETETMSDFEKESLRNVEFLTRLRMYPHAEISKRIQHAQIDVFDMTRETFSQEFITYCKANIKCSI